MNSFILWFIWHMEMLQPTWKSHTLKLIYPLTLFLVCYKLFKIALMCGLWLLANQDISRHQCNSERSAKDRCYLTQQEQTSWSLQRCIIFMASKRCLNAAKVRHNIELPNINQWIRTCHTTFTMTVKSSKPQWSHCTYGYQIHDIQLARFQVC